MTKQPFKRKQVTVSVSRTVQLVQFHPVSVTVSETAEIPEGATASDVKTALHKSASASVDKFINVEIEKYENEKEGN